MVIIVYLHVLNVCCLLYFSLVLVFFVFSFALFESCALRSFLLYMHGIAFAVNATEQVICFILYIFFFIHSLLCLIIHVKLLSRICVCVVLAALQNRKRCIWSAVAAVVVVSIFVIFSHAGFMYWIYCRVSAPLCYDLMDPYVKNQSQRVTCIGNFDISCVSADERINNKIYFFL